MTYREPDGVDEQDWDAYLKVSGYINQIPPTVLQSAQSSRPTFQLPSLPKVDLGWVAIAGFGVLLGYMYMTATPTEETNVTLWDKILSTSKNIVTFSANHTEAAIDFINPAAEMQDTVRKGDSIAGFVVTDDMNGVRDYGKHAAIDLGTPEGTSIRMPYDGTIKPVEDDNCGYGAYIYLKQAPNYQIVLCHLLTPPLEGEFKAQEIVARSGATGRGSGPHLHVQLWKIEITADGQVKRVGKPLTPSKDLLTRLLRSF